jgi:hypothetical protein
MGFLMIAALLATASSAPAQPAYDKSALDALFDGARQAGDPAEPPPSGPRGAASGLALGGTPPTPPLAPESPPAAMDGDERLRVAAAVAPVLVWSNGEGCGDHDVLFQVHPHGDGLARVTYVLVFPRDCGFRSGNIIGGHHGDVQEMTVEAARSPDGSWRAASIEVPWFPPFPPRSDHATLYVSSGKHHVYPNREACRTKFFHLDDCGGGAVERLDLSPEHDVGEAAHPAFVTLERIARGPWAAGYAQETAWGPSGPEGGAYFCGGDPGRGGRGSLWGKLKKLVGWDSCADAVGTKWTVDPTPEAPPAPPFERNPG